MICLLENKTYYLSSLHFQLALSAQNLMAHGSLHTVAWHNDLRGKPEKHNADISFCSYHLIYDTNTKPHMLNSISYHILFVPCPFPEDLKGLSCMKHTRSCKHNLEFKDVRITTEK